ncbi:hypothetical protein Asi02nite_54720 [Asanoa siamensis]|uniref:Anti-sigma factor antagonist n=2 Tax=Asanoa siamensis TaxID=926357 RepID=A0ABQ4CXE3_9ACTN|nr:hypothetical protein Asi02nite_54720 [Asanoa siamensis]
MPGIFDRDGDLDGGLSVTVSGAPGGGSITAAGEVDMNTAGKLFEAIRDALRRGPDVAVDLSAVTFLDSQGIHVLVRGRQEAAERGGTLTVTDCARPVRRVLEIAGVLALLTGDDPA